MVSVFGLKGELILHHHLGKKTSLKDLELIFLEEKKGEMLPHFVEKTKIKNESEIYIKLEGTDTKEKARTMLQKEVWLREEDFSRYAGKSAPISLVGFKIIDNGRELGEVLEVMEQPHQTICRLEMEGREVLIPITEEFLKHIDRKNKLVTVVLPEGLLDVYLK